MNSLGSKLLICSDLHYASAAEKERGAYELNSITNPVQKFVIKAFRNLVWLADPFAHNHLVEQILNPPIEPAMVVANGDFSCDSAFIGVADLAAQQSAREVLAKFHTRYGERFFATFGDHELGKRTLAGGKGGMRLASWEAARGELKLKPFWVEHRGDFVVMGVTSSLIAYPVYEKEALREEHPKWELLRREQMSQIRETFLNLHEKQRVLLFCHDPSALPFLHDDPVIGQRLDKISRTIIGHLHTPIVLWKSRLLAGMPPITFFGNAIRRMSTALHHAAKWKPFKVLLCPSPAGVQLRKKGGYYMTDLDMDASKPLHFQFHQIDWNLGK